MVGGFVTALDMVGEQYKRDGCPSHCMATVKAASLLEVERIQDQVPEGCIARPYMGPSKTQLPLAPSPMLHIYSLTGKQKLF